MKNHKQILEAIDRGIKFALTDLEDDDELTSISKQKIGQITDDDMQQHIVNKIKNNKVLSVFEWNNVKNNLSHYLNLLGITDEQFYIIRYMVGRYNADELDKDLYKIFEENKPLFVNKFRKITSKRDLQKIIIDAIKENGPNCDLNWIDVSGVTDMSYLFNFTEYLDYSAARDFIKQYPFNCDISKWDVSNVKSMEGMFCGCDKFNQDISNWDVSEVVNMECMFLGATKFNQPIGKWNVSKVIVFENMFNIAESFNQDISNWKLRSDADIFNKDEKDPIKIMFNWCPIKPEFLPKQLQKTNEIQ